MVLQIRFLLYLCDILETSGDGYKNEDFHNAV